MTSPSASPLTPLFFDAKHQSQNTKASKPEHQSAQSEAAKAELKPPPQCQEAYALRLPPKKEKKRKRNMKKNPTYLIALALLAASCGSDDLGNDTQTLSGDGTKTPLSVTALLDAGGTSQTRAADMAFANNDKLLTYLRHVTWDGSTGARTLVTVDRSPVLVTFTKGSEAMTPYSDGDITPIGTNIALGLTDSNTRQTADLTTTPPLYWDDFSANSSADNTAGSTNLREQTHYLQSYYGYCFNGGEGDNNTEGTTVQGNITAALVPAAGTLGWQVATDQSSANTSDANAFQHSDLLWSAEQNPVPYAHVDGEGKRNHGTLILPYTHAMSKVTINVTVADGFASDFKLNGVTTTLHNMFTTCTCKAPTYELTAKGAFKNSTNTQGAVSDITMWQGVTTTAKTCTYEAIVVPSILSVVNKLATISDLDGNDYTIPITDAMLQKASTASDGKGWGDELVETNENIQDGIAQARPQTRATIEKGKGYEMKSGVNYVLNVTLSKQGITVSALIKDWHDVEAIGEGKVQFDGDITSKEGIAEALKAHGFDVYKNSVNTAFPTKTTTLKWENGKWTYDPAIYWAGKGDEAYFRALSPMGTTTAMSQGNDVLWGYACDDDANNGSKVGTPDEVKITPRTGDVPLHFEHAMSKITVQLETAEGNHTLATSPAVDLTGAKIEISNLYKEGTLELTKGSISTTDKTKVEKAIGPTNSITNLAVIPQEIANESIVKITLKDGTVYKLKLNDCKVLTGKDPETQEPIYGDRITQWVRGNHYTYTIHIEKEAITFRALIKDWDEKEGSGNATLEWD